MTLNIKSIEADSVAREKERVQAPGLAQRLKAIGERYRELPDQDRRSDDQILGYDEMLG